MSNDEPTICEQCKCCSTCWRDCDDCGGEGGQGSSCIDDMCHGQDECIHGDTGVIPCGICEGKGGWWSCGGCCLERDETHRL